MVGWRIPDAEEVVQDRPDVALTMGRLAWPDVKDDDASRPPGRHGRLHRERQPVAAVQVNAAHDRLERPGQTVRPELWSARIPAELLVDALVSGSLSGQGIDELAHGAWRDDLVVGHASLR